MNDVDEGPQAMVVLLLSTKANIIRYLDTLPPRVEIPVLFFWIYSGGCNIT